MIVHRTMNDVTRRKRNVVISGMIENDRYDDRLSFLQLCETWLTFKPALAEGSCVRLGQLQPGHPRRLLVRTGSEEIAAALIHDAPLFAHALDEYVRYNIFINPDLSPAAAKLAFERRQARRNARQQEQQDRGEFEFDYDYEFEEDEEPPRRQDYSARQGPPAGSERVTVTDQLSSSISPLAAPAVVTAVGQSSTAVLTGTAVSAVSEQLPAAAASVAVTAATTVSSQLPVSAMSDGTVQQQGAPAANAMPGSYSGTAGSSAPVQ
jgi:hypothetical protein